MRIDPLLVEEDKRGGPRGDKMEDRVRRVGKEFFPVGFETSGASTSQCSKLLKKLSEIAHERRGHHKAYFMAFLVVDFTGVHNALGCRLVQK